MTIKITWKYTSRSPLSRFCKHKKETGQYRNEYLNGNDYLVIPMGSWLYSVSKTLVKDEETLLRKKFNFTLKKKRFAANIQKANHAIVYNNLGAIFSDWMFRFSNVNMVKLIQCASELFISVIWKKTCALHAKGVTQAIRAPRAFTVRSRVLSRLASLATQNGELPWRLHWSNWYTTREID